MNRPRAPKRSLNRLVRHLAATAALAGLAPLAWADIVIGASFTQTGPGSALGIPSKNAMALFPTEIAGEKIRLVVLDDASDPTNAARNARRLTTEEKADVLIGSTTGPTALAIAEVAFETETVQLASAPIDLPDNRNKWTFRLPQAVPLMAEGVVDHMVKSGVKTVGFLGYSDAYGESWLRDTSRYLQAKGIKLVATERFTRADTSVVSQALKVVSAKPDAVLVVASGAGAAMPHLTLKERGYQGLIYQTYAAVAQDILRVGGKGIEGGFGVSGPAALPHELPATHPSRKVSLEFVQAYEAKYGAGTYNQFSANIWGGWLVLERALPFALKKAKPGTPEFRAALRDAIEQTRELVVPQGVVNYSPTDHFGYDARGRFMLQVKDGAWKAVR